MDSVAFQPVRRPTPTPSSLGSRHSLLFRSSPSVIMLKCLSVVCCYGISFLFSCERAVLPLRRRSWSFAPCKKYALRLSFCMQVLRFQRMSSVATLGFYFSYSLVFLWVVWCLKEPYREQDTRHRGLYPFLHSFWFAQMSLQNVQRVEDVIVKVIQLRAR